MQVINQYSAIWLFAILVGVLGILLLRRKTNWTRRAALGVLILGLIAVWFVLRPRQTGQFLSATQVQAGIGHGIPVLLEFQSPY